MPVYRTSGVLTGTIEPENVAEAQAYLLEPNMEDYLDQPLDQKVLRLTWHLHADGHSWHVDAVTAEELTEEELTLLASNVSGQNSDGHGENFEQQDFAWLEDDDEYQDCWGCDGDGEIEGATCPTCLGDGFIYGARGGRMCSFDWETNDCKFERVK